MKLKTVMNILQNIKDKSDDIDEVDRIDFIQIALSYIEGNNPEIDNTYLRNILLSHGLNVDKIMEGEL